MDDLRNILLSKNWDEPPEIRDIKDFVRRRWKSEVKVSLRGAAEIIVCSPSAPLIASLRNNLPELMRAVQTDKKIILRIG